MTTTLEGFDISHFQTALTPDRVGQLLMNGYAFAGIKASEGDYQTDIHFAANREALRSHAVPRWIYHEATTTATSGQFSRIMAATGGQLYPRERLVLVLGDFSVPPSIAADLAAMLETYGPTKGGRHHGHGDKPRWRPRVILYANRSKWKDIYLANAQLAARPRIVAAYPGPAEIPCVIHQYGGGANPDPATRGDRDRWIGEQIPPATGGTALDQLREFFLS